MLLHSRVNLKLFTRSACPADLFCFVFFCSHLRSSVLSSDTLFFYFVANNCCCCCRCVLHTVFYSQCRVHCPFTHTHTWFYSQQVRKLKFTLNVCIRTAYLFILLKNEAKKKKQQQLVRSALCCTAKSASVFSYSHLNCISSLCAPALGHWIVVHNTNANK